MRHLLLLLGMSLLAGPALAQQPEALERVPVRPPDFLPLENQGNAALQWSETGTPLADLSEEDLLRRFARVYRYQADLLGAEAVGDDAQAEQYLRLALADLSVLSRQPGITEQTRYRELYRTLVAEADRYYGTSDTLVLPFGDIFAFRTQLFMEMNALDDPLLDQVTFDHVPMFATTVPMTVNRLVENSIQYLLRTPEKHLHHWLSRAETYFPMVEEIFAEEGVPDELKYLAMIESGLNPRARSWAKASGMWQFIAATGRAYGLNVNSWVDERRDPEKATRAAARHLNDLYKMFGDWHLALAGYNYSPGKLRRHIRRVESQTGRKATFWDVYPYIPRETRNYVPMFIAASLVASNPQAFNVAPVTPGPRYAYDYVPIHGMLSLDEVAEMAGTATTTLQALNPELRRSTLPPTDGPYYLRLPLGTYDQFAAAYAALPESARQPATEHVVRRGESLGKIANRYGVTVASLKRKNGLRKNTIHPGQRLVVPMGTYEGTPLPIADAQPISVQYGTRSQRPIAMPDRVEVNVSPPVTRASNTVNTSNTTSRVRSGTRVVYTVRRGDTIGEIAEKYNVRTSQIRSWNNIRGSRINVGQKLTLYVPNRGSSNTASSPAANTTTQAATAAVPERAKTTYKVRRGDTLGEIASRHGVSINDLRQWNGIRGSRIRTGQRLTIYTNPGSSAGASVTTYTVRRGDTLSEIASRHGVSIANLKRWNNLSNNRIRVGQRLEIRG